MTPRTDIPVQLAVEVLTHLNHGFVLAPRGKGVTGLGDRNKTDASLTELDRRTWNWAKLRLSWAIQDVDYLETMVRRERQGISHSVSIRVSLGQSTGPAHSGATPSSGTKQSTPTPDCWASPPCRSTPPEAGRSSR